MLARNEASDVPRYEPRYKRVVSYRVGTTIKGEGERGVELSLRVSAKGEAAGVEV